MNIEEDKLDKKINVLIDQLAPQVKAILELQTPIVNNLELRINYIINNHIKDNSYIETTLDNLLNLMQTDKITNLYKKLCRYYYSIDKKSAIEYASIYLEMYPEEKEKIKKYKKSIH